MQMVIPQYPTHILHFSHICPQVITSYPPPGKGYPQKYLEYPQNFANYPECIHIRRQQEMP